MAKLEAEPWQAPVVPITSPGGAFDPAADAEQGSDGATRDAENPGKPAPERRRQPAARRSKPRSTRTQDTARGAKKAAAEGDTGKISVLMTTDEIERIRAAWLNAPLKVRGTSFSQWAGRVLIEAAKQIETDYNDGETFEPVDGLPTGRPFGSKNRRKTAR